MTKIENKFKWHLCLIGQLTLFALLLVGARGQAQSSTQRPAAPPATLGKVKFLTGNKFNSYCAIDLNDNLVCWGPEVPPISPAIGKVKSVSFNSDAICAVVIEPVRVSPTKKTNLVCWGSHGYGPIERVPDDIAMVENVAIGDFLACVQADSRVRCWRLDMPPAQALREASKRFFDSPLLAMTGQSVCGFYYQERLICQNIWDVGLEEPTKIINHPVGTSLKFEVDDGDAGCAIKDTGLIECFGFEFEIGHGTAPPSEPALEISVGRLQACAIMALDHKITCWDLFQPPYFSGASIPIFDIALKLAVGYENGCAIIQDETVKCWASGN